MNKTQHTDVWAAGDLYEPYVGRWSRRVAREFLHWLDLPAGADWVDVGCGTGALVQTILEQAAPSSVRGVEPSRGFVEYARARVTDKRACFLLGDARSLPIATASADAAVAGLVLNFVPEPLQAVTEMARIVRPGGVIGVYVWDYADRMELMRYFWDAVVALDPAAAEHDEGRRFPICQPKPLGDLFIHAGLHEVEVRSIDIRTDFRNFDDYWSPFLGGQGAAPAYAMSLDEAQRGAISDWLRSRLPIAEDGTIHLLARAWAVRGRKP